MPKPRGLRNNGNTCYFNATLQNLYRTAVFQKKLAHVYDLLKQKNQEPEQKNELVVENADGMEEVVENGDGMEEVVETADGLEGVVVNESTSSESSVRARLWCSFIKRLHRIRNGISAYTAKARSSGRFLNQWWFSDRSASPQLPVQKVGIVQGVDQQLDEAISEAISVALARLFRKIDSGSEGSCHNPRSVLEAVCRRSNRFLGFRQQDSHELLRHLLDGIREEERNLKEETKSLTLVDRVFGGHFRTVYTCEMCSSPYCLYEAFLDISLPITLHEDTLKEISDTDNTEILTSTVMPQQHNIEFWLKVFTRSENLGKQYLCSVCNASSTGDNYFLTCGKKQTLICDPPAILCIHVKRFRKTAGDFVKANDHVEFSEYLDLKPYLTDDCRRLGENKEIVMYALYGVVVHSGSLESGHYTAYIKSQTGHGQDITADNTDVFLQQEDFDWDSLPTGTIGRLKTESLNIQQNSSYLNQTRQWYYCSDSTVMPVAADEVLNQAAYLLFYERLC